MKSARPVSPDGAPEHRPVIGLAAEPTDLKPIGRLAVSGPSPAPQRYADAGLGSNWFAAKKQPEPEAAEPAAEQAAEPATKPVSEPAPAENPAEPAAENPGEVVHLDLTTLIGQVESTGEQVPPRRMPGETPEPVLPAPRPVRPLGPKDLEAIRWRLDGGTLREVVDDRTALLDLGEGLDERLTSESDDLTRSGLLSVRAEVYRLLGELGMAAAASRLALTHAETARDLPSTVVAQAELAHVLRLRGDFAEADRLFEAAFRADLPDALRSVVHENAGRSCFDQGRHMEALNHFAQAARLGDPGDQDLAERIGVSLQAVYIHVLRDGWGPYPRR